jgi:signal transduction histidine kinase/CheY-like chemotaxis protein
LGTSDADHGAGFPAGGGETGALMRAADWSAFPLGPPAGWPSAFRAALSICLGSASPIVAMLGRSAAELRIFYNDAYRPVLGARHPQAFGAPAADAWPEIWEALAHILDAVLVRGEPVRRENQHFVLHRHGFPEDAWFTYSHSPIREADGTISGVFTLIVEVTERVLSARRAEALLALEAALRELDDPDAVLSAATAVLGRELRLDRCGYAEVAPGGQVLTIRRDWTGGALPSLAGELPLDDIGQELVTEYRDGRAVRLEDRWQDARTRAVESAYSRGGARAGLAVPLLKDGRLVAITYAHTASPRRWTDGEEAFVRDMAECIWAAVARARADHAMRRAQAALRAGEERLRLAVDGAGAATWDMDLATGEGIWSERHFDMFGLPRAEGGRATQAMWQSRIHPDDLPLVTGALGSSLEGGEPHRAEYRILRADTGEVRRMLCYGQVIRGEDGAPRSIGVMFDVTEERAAEAALRRLNEELEARVREEVAAREAAQGQLAHAQRMEALGQLAGGIAHDFNNVMQAVAGGAGLIRRKARDPQTVDHLARMVEESTRRGASITRRLLAFARRDELRAEPVPCAALLDDLREVLAHTLGRRVEVRTVVAAPAGSLPPLLADRGQLETVLINLATNARDAMPDGGTLTLAVEAEAVQRPQPFVEGPKPGHYIRISVTDTGSGMPAEILARAAEPFFTTKERGRGTGLGLSMARGFAEQSGGALAIRSTPGLGTTVTLWLPVAREAGPDPAQPAAGQCEPVAATLLLVDDERLVREVVASGLEEAGHTVLRAPNAAAALAMLDAGARIDLLLTDYTMPGLDGLALIREARRRRPGLPALLLTGNAGDGAQEAAVVLDAIGGGECSLLRKPVTADDVAARVAMLLRAASPGKGAAFPGSRPSGRR